MMLANIQGSTLALKSQLNITLANPSQLVDHQNEKEHYYSCYITGMKAYFKGKRVKPAKMKRIERELDASDTNRSDFKRVLMRFQKE